MSVLSYDDLMRFVESRRREAMKIAFLARAMCGRGGGRRSVEDSLKLSMLALEQFKELIEVVSWSRSAMGERVLRIR